MATQLFFVFIFVIVLGLASFFYEVRNAHASVSSFISDLFFESANSQETQTSHSNSQNMELLEARGGQNPSLGDGEITIVDETALESQNDTPGENITYPQNGQISVYVVRKGDTLSQIAKMYGVSVNTILWANDITGGVIGEGQTLTILPISGVKHIVKSGDTIQSITKKHGGDLKEVLQFNNLAVDAKLALGEEIIIPDGETSVSAQNTTGSNSGSTGSTKKPTIPSKFSKLPDYGDYYMRPIAGGRKTQGIHGYNGVDLASSRGTPVMASAAGKVIVSKNSGWNGGYGNYIVIQHNNGTQTLYAHLEKSIVFQGLSVGKGQVIGYVGSSGRSTGPHVHFEVRGARNPH